MMRQRSPEHPSLHALPASPRGLSLIELMITLMIAAMLALLAAPSFTQLMTRNRSTTQSEELMSVLRWGSSEALRRGIPISFRSLSNDGNFTSGWTLFTDLNADGAAPGTITDDDGTVLREMGPLPGTTTLIRVDAANVALPNTDAQRMFVVFNEKGGHDADVPAFFRLCTAPQTTTGFMIEVSAVGKISQLNATSNCP